MHSAPGLMKSSHMPGRRNIVLIALAAIVVVAAVFALTRVYGEKDLLQLVEHLHGYGRHWWAPAALIAVVTVINLIGLPGTPLTLASGAVWGWIAGAGWMMTATMIGTAVPYFLALHGFAGLRERLEKRFKRSLEWIEDSGFTAVAILRLSHIFPFALISYAAGFAGVRKRDYFAGTFIGTLPGVLIYTYLADSIVSGIMSPDVAKRRIMIAAGLLIVFVIATNVIARRFRKRRQ